MKKKIFTLLLVFVALFTITGCGGKKSDKKKDRSLKEYDEAFFIKEGDKYALFNTDGKKLTDFVYTYASSFNNGIAIVERDDKKGVINSNGKMVIDFGKYKYIYQSAGLLKVKDEEYNEYLLNASGKKIADLKDMKLITYIGEGNYSILYDKNKNKYQVLDADGNAMVTFDGGKDDEEPTTNTSGGYLSVHSGNKNYIIDLVSRKKLLEFEAKEHYCVNVVSKDGKKMTLNSCVGTFQSQDVVKYKFINDGKLYDLSEKCDKILLSGDNFICSKGYDEYLIDENNKVGIAIDDVSYKDNNHYAKAHNGSFEGIDFYEKDKVITNVACRTLSSTGYSKDGLFLLTTYYSKTCGTESGTYEFYNTKGEKAFDKSFARAEYFDENSLAIVSEDKTNYYLIDTKGKKVSADYTRIYRRNNYYEVVKADLEGALDTKGNVIVDAKYEDIGELQHNGENYITLNLDNKKYTLYSLDKNKEVASFNDKPYYETNYITITKNGKTEYYTYTGKLFYTSK